MITRSCEAFIAPFLVGGFGIAQSAALGIASGLVVFTAPSVAQTSAFSTIAQGAGYTLAALGPLPIGLVDADTLLLRQHRLHQFEEVSRQV